MTAVAQHSDPKVWKEKCQQSNSKCVCEICTCHKHHCPPKHVPFSADTTNHELYKPYNVKVERSQKCGYSLNKSHYDPSLLKSTYREDYKGKTCEPAQHQSRYAYQPNTAKFYDQTEYKKSYVPNKIEVKRSGPCNAQFRPNSARFEGSTTYGTAFKATRGEQVHSKSHYAYQPNTLPFYGHTTYGDSFHQHQIQYERPVTCAHGHYTGSPGKFQGATSYHENFKGLQNPRRNLCFIEELPPRPRECSPGKEHLHFCAHDCKWN